MIPGEHPVGYIDVSFYRDDYARTGLKAGAKRSDLPFDVDGATIVLVDDVLYTGRSVRAAINELFDYGRPARIELAVLVDRGGRELPIEATYCGARLAVARDLSHRACARRGRRLRFARREGRERLTSCAIPQLNADGELTHLLTLEGLPAPVITQHPRHRGPVRVDRRARSRRRCRCLRGKAVFNLFFENSTRTRTTFEIAAKRLSADVINLNIGVVVDEQGRDAARHRRQPGRDGRRHFRRAACAVRRAAPHRRST